MLVLRLLFKGLKWLLAGVGIYLLLAVVGSLIPVGSAADKTKALRNKRFYIASNGVHTDIVLPRADVPQQLRDELPFFADYAYWAFGWGDKGFYLDTPTWAELKVSTAIRAMLLPSPTAMHVTGYNGVGEGWVTDPLTADQLAQLTTYIYDSFDRSAPNPGAGAGARVIEGAAYGKNDQFFEAVGNYNAIHTCNNWVNEGLKEADVRTALWAPSEWGVMRWRKKVSEK